MAKEFTLQELIRQGGTPGYANQPAAQTGRQEFTLEELLAAGAKPPPKVGAVETFVNRAVDTLPLGRPVVNALSAGVGSAAQALGVGQRSPMLTPEAEAELRASGVETPAPQEAPGLMDVYRQMRDRRDLRTDAGVAQNPTAAKLGTGTGIALQMLAPIPKGLGGAGAAARGGQQAERGLLAAMAAGAGKGALMGGIQSAGDSRADLTRLTSDEFGEQLKDMAVGAGLGFGLGGVLTGLGRGAKSFYEGFVEPSAAAQWLRSRGVPLTVAQMNPKTAAAQMEEVSTSLPVVGPSIAAQRDAAKSAWQARIAEEVKAPGMGKLDSSLPFDEQLKAIDKGFNELYDAVRSAEIPTGAPVAKPLADAFKNAVDDPDALATPETQAVVSRFLNNQLGLLNKPGVSDAGGKPLANTLMTMRHNVRQAIRDASKADQSERVRLLTNAEEALTDTIEARLPDYARDALRAADAQYAPFMTVLNASARAGNSPGGVTPKNLTDALKSTMSERQFKLGEKTELGNFAEMGAKVFEAKVPVTGARMLAAPAAAFVSPLSFMANLPAGQRFALGETALQRNLQGIGQSAAARALRDRASTTLSPTTRTVVGRDFTPEPSPQEAARRKAKALAEALRQR